MSDLLPARFSALEEFVAYWAADTLSARDTRRLDSSEAQCLAFYRAAAPSTTEAFAHLDAKPFAKFEAADWRLHWLMLSLVHVTLAVEVQRDGEPIHARGARRMPIVWEHASQPELAGKGI